MRIAPFGISLRGRREWTPERQGDLALGRAETVTTDRPTPRPNRPRADRYALAEILARRSRRGWRGSARSPLLQDVVLGQLGAASIRRKDKQEDVVIRPVGSLVGGAVMRRADGHRSPPTHNPWLVAGLP